MSAAVVADEAAVEVVGINPADALQIMVPGSDRMDRLTWLAKRRTGCGASDVSAIFGLSKYNAIIDVWEEKTGLVPLLADRGDSEAAKWGRLLEPVVRDEYARIAGIQITTVGMLRSQRWPWLICDPDGLVVDERAGYEGKTSSAFAKDWNSEEIADHAELQAQACMAVTGFEQWHVACLVGGQKPVFHIIDRDDELIGHIVAATHRFWYEHVLTSVPPPPDDSAAFGSWLDRRHPADDGGYVEIDPTAGAELEAEHRAVEVELDSAEARKRALVNRVKSLLGDAQRLLVGEREILTWKTTAKFAEAQFRKTHPELAARYSRERPLTYVDTTELSVDHPKLYREFCSRPLTWKD